MAGMGAGALGIRLGGTNRYYRSRLEHRSVMGDGRAVRPEDIGRAARLARRVGIIGAVVSASARCSWLGAQRAGVR